VIGVAGADLSLDDLIDEVLAMKVQGELDLFECNVDSYKCT
jgi:hypothetical protein